MSTSEPFHVWGPRGSFDLFFLSGCSWIPPRCPNADGWDWHKEMPACKGNGQSVPQLLMQRQANDRYYMRSSDANNQFVLMCVLERCRVDCLMTVFNFLASPCEPLTIKETASFPQPLQPSSGNCDVVRKRGNCIFTLVLRLIKVWQGLRGESEKAREMRTVGGRKQWSASV